MVSSKRVQQKNNFKKSCADLGAAFFVSILHRRRMTSSKIKETKFIHLMTTFSILELTVIAGKNAALYWNDIDVMLIEIKQFTIFISQCINRNFFFSERNSQSKLVFKIAMTDTPISKNRPLGSTLLLTNWKNAIVSIISTPLAIPMVAWSGLIFLKITSTIRPWTSTN